MSPRLRRLTPALVLVVVLLCVAAAVPTAASARHGRDLGGATRPNTPGKAERAARIALSEIGVPYVWGGESPRGFDCSGLVRFAYGQVGISLPHNSYALYGTGRAVSRANLEPGDILFFSGLGHVGMYVGNGRMVHAPQTGQSVEVVSLASGYGASFVAARRVVAS